MAEVVSDWTKIPVTSISLSESDSCAACKSLEAYAYTKRVIGQERGSNGWWQKLYEGGRVGLKDPKSARLVHFMFLGPTGVGKTELVQRHYAEALFWR